MGTGSGSNQEGAGGNTDSSAFSQGASDQSQSSSSVPVALVFYHADEPEKLTSSTPIHGPHFSYGPLMRFYVNKEKPGRIELSNDQVITYYGYSDRKDTYETHELSPRSGDNNSRYVFMRDSINQSARAILLAIAARDVDLQQVTSELIDFISEELKVTPLPSSGMPIKEALVHIMSAAFSNKRVWQNIAHPQLRNLVDRIAMVYQKRGNKLAQLDHYNMSECYQYYYIDFIHLLWLVEGKSVTFPLYENLFGGVVTGR